MTESPYQSERISQLLLERYNLGELDAEEKRQVEALLRDDGETAARLRLLRDQDREIRAAYPPEKAFPASLSRAPGRRARLASRAFPVRPAALSLAACAAAALFFFLALFHGQPAERNGIALTDRVKGGTELRVYLKPGETPLGDTAVLHAGNTVQLAYTSGKSRYGVIFSIDGRKVVTLHFPYRSGGSTALVQGKRTALEEAYTLDDAPYCEIFFFVSSGSPVDVASVLHNAEILAGDPGTALERGTALFSEYEIETVYVGKE
ncbi:MAG: hypothetical protein LBK40_01210 [Spirochaetaceae bacterium]|jgi:hypothetical protein|nr:hypothetical protein [Spirochaetaceae bacterium]